MILISQGHFTFELTLAGLLEDILTRFRNERILLSLSDPAIGIQGELLIAEATIFAARVDKPLVEGYSALKNLCQFAGAEFAINKLDNAEIEPLKRTICIDLAKLIKVVPALPPDPTSLLSASAFAPIASTHGVVGAPVVVSVPPAQLPPLPQQQMEGNAIELEQGSISAKQRIDMAFEAAIQKRVATKGKGKIDLLSGRSASQVFADATPNNAVQSQPAPQPPQQPQIPEQQQAFSQPDLTQFRPVELMPVPSKAPDIAVPVDNNQFKSDPFSPKVNYAPKDFNLVNESLDFADQPADFPDEEDEEDIDWHRVRAAAEKVEPVSKEPTISFSLAEQIQQELAAGDQVEIAEPLQRKALKRTFVGPVAAIRLAIAKLWRIAIPVGIILAIMQGGKMWMDTHGGSNNVKSVMDIFGTKPVKHAPPAAVVHKEVSKPVGHAISHHESVGRASGLKVAPSKASASRVAAKSVAPGDATKTSAPQGAPISAYERISNKYANSAIMRDPVKPSADASGRRHAYQTAPSDANAGQ